MIRFGGCSMKLRIGHPAEHLPHWKQRDTFDPERVSTFLTNPRFIVSCERGILVCFIFIYILTYPGGAKRLSARAMKCCLRN